MAYYSQKGHDIGHAAVLQCVIQVIEDIAPGRVQAALDGTAVNVSGLLEKDPTNENFHDTLTAIGHYSEWLQDHINRNAEPRS